LVNGIGVLIHHDAGCAPFLSVAFIFDERRAGMVNRRFLRGTFHSYPLFRVNSALKNIR
jgi:hypothetical protein